MTPGIRTHVHTASGCGVGKDRSEPRRFANLVGPDELHKCRVNEVLSFRADRGGSHLGLLVATRHRPIITVVVHRASWGQTAGCGRNPPSTTPTHTANRPSEKPKG